MLLEGLYAVKLNADFYREHIPFFDSCSYNNQLASIWAIERSSGIAGGIEHALQGNVALPWLETAVLAPFVMPSRFIGVWLQWVWLWLLALSLFWYFTGYRNSNPFLAVCLTLPFVSFARIYDWNGGLLDFRMDLSLYIFLSLTAVWYLITYQTESVLPWLLAGVSAMLACLARATAPVYLAVTFGPLLAIRFWRASGRQRVWLLRNALWMGLPIALGLLFQVYNFRYLYFYYVISEGDANRHLPLSQSAMHLLLSGAHLGIATALCSLAVLGLSFRTGIARWFRRVDYKVLWLGLAAPFFLTLARAGLNPFVSMPAVFGLLLFSYFPLRKEGMTAAQGKLRWVVCVLLAGSSVLNAVQAKRPSLFTGADATRMSGMKALIGRINSNAAARHQRDVRYIIPEIGEFHSCALNNTLIYEYGGTPGEDGSIRLPAGIRYSFPQGGVFAAAQRGGWDRSLPGVGDSETLNDLTPMAMQLPDYLLLPTDAALDFLERHRAGNINLKVRELKSQLLGTGAWTELGGPVAITPDKSIELYVRKAPASPLLPLFAPEHEFPLHHETGK